MWRKLPAGPVDGVAAIAGDPMAGADDACQLLGVQVQQFAGLRPLVAARGWRQLQHVQPRPATAAHDARDRRPTRPPTCGRDLATRPPLLAQHLDAQHHRRRPWPAGCAGVASCDPRVPRPPRRGPPTSVPWRSVVCSGPGRRCARGVPSWVTRRTASARPRSVNRAFLWMFIRGSSSAIWSAWQRPASLRAPGWITLTLTGRGERMRASGPVERVVSLPLISSALSRVVRVNGREPPGTPSEAQGRQTQVRGRWTPRGRICRSG